MGLEKLAEMEYPGRFIVVGSNHYGHLVVGYGLTGRSPPSKAREFLEGEKTHTVRTNATDPEELKKGSPALLLYPAITFLGNHVVASNGAQTKLLYSALLRDLERGLRPSPETVLREALKEPFWEYDQKEDQWIDITTFEPDKYHTPRINLVAHPSEACLHIVKEYEGRRHDQFYTFSLKQTEGKFISTYNGPSEPVAFQGQPHLVTIPLVSAEELSRYFFNALKPEYRVSVVAAIVEGSGKVSVGNIK